MQDEDKIRSQMISLSTNVYLSASLCMSIFLPSSLFYGVMPSLFGKFQGKGLGDLDSDGGNVLF
jgi:hypothetical protein